MDRPHTSKVISDIVNNMSDAPLAWYVENVQRLALMMDASYDSTHAMILQIRNQ